MTDTKQTSAIADATAAPRSGRLPAAQDSGPSGTPVRNGHLIGYARVSSAQDLALQLDALEHAGCERVYQDVGSGSIRSRPQLNACLEQLLPGDKLVVWRLDRLGRSLRHLIDVIAGLQQREIAFRSLRESIDTTTATGRLQLHLFAALAEFERELILERRRTQGGPSPRAPGRAPQRHHTRAARRRDRDARQARANDGADHPHPEDQTVHPLQAPRHQPRDSHRARPGGVARAEARWPPLLVGWCHVP